MAAIGIRHPAAIPAFVRKHLRLRIARVVRRLCLSRIATQDVSHSSCGVATPVTPATPVARKSLIQIH